MKARKAYVGERVINLFGTITEVLELDVTREMVHLMEKDQESPIYILIDGKGGSFDSAMRIREKIRSCGVETIGVVLGLAYSSALLVLQACDKRMALPNTGLLAHFAKDLLNLEVSQENGLAEIIKQVTDSYETVCRKNEEIIRIYTQKMNLPDEDVLKFLKNPRILTPEEAIGLGLLDSIAGV